MNKIFLSHMYLIKELSKREILAKYKGSFLGILWSFITPLAMLLLFTFIFSEVFQVKWANSGYSSNKLDFSVNLFVGLSIFWFFAEILGKAPSVFSSVPNYIKKVIFPLEILPVVSLLSALFNLIIYLIIIVGIVFYIKGTIFFSLLFLPLLIGISFPMLMGFCLLLGSLGVYIKDIATFMNVFINMLMFLSPIFYPLESLPKSFHTLFMLNPLTYIIEESRNIIILGNYPDFEKMFYYFLISIFIYFLGKKVYEVTKKGFADVL